MIYFIRHGKNGAIKIGYSLNVSKRLKQLQTSHFETLELIGCVFGDVVLEKKLHSKFDHLHLRGEWFRAGKDLLDFIAEHRDKRFLEIHYEDIYVLEKKDAGYTRCMCGAGRGKSVPADHHTLGCPARFGETYASR